MSARDQVTRLLALVPYLQARGEVPLSEVAADFEVAPTQIRKDLEVLWMCGLPGFGPGELIDIDFESIAENPDGLVRIDNAEYLSRPVRLDSVEASALVVALRALREGSPATSREVIDRTLAKLETVAGTGPAPVEVVQPSRGPMLQRREDLERAISGDRQVQLEYYVPTRDETTLRVVDPVSLIRQDGYDYLDAWCHLARDRRVFRLSRVERLTVLDTPRVRRQLPARSGVFEADAGAVLATVRLAAHHRWFVDYYPVAEGEGSVRELAGGRLEVDLHVNDPRWLVRLALRLAPGLEIVAPSGLSALADRTARATLALYDPGVG